MAVASGHVYTPSTTVRGGAAVTEQEGKPVQAQGIVVQATVGKITVPRDQQQQLGAQRAGPVPNQQQ